MIIGRCDQPSHFSPHLGPSSHVMPSRHSPCFGGIASKLGDDVIRLLGCLGILPRTIRPLTRSQALVCVHIFLGDFNICVTNATLQYDLIDHFILPSNKLTSAWSKRKRVGSTALLFECRRRITRCHATTCFLSCPCRSLFGCDVAGGAPAKPENSTPLRKPDWLKLCRYTQAEFSGRKLPPMKREEAACGAVMTTPIASRPAVV
ncbi:hypothetical protein V8F33_001725 [Rhypophila sp. PSN 637]